MVDYSLGGGGESVRVAWPAGVGWYGVSHATDYCMGCAKSKNLVITTVPWHGVGRKCRAFAHKGRFL